MLNREQIERSDNLRLVSKDKRAEARAALKLVEAFKDGVAVGRRKMTAQALIDELDALTKA